jgi:hypothetical protein
MSAPPPVPSSSSLPSSPCPQVISLLSVEPLTSPQQFSSVYTVYELMETDLHSVIKSPQKLTTEHIQVQCPPPSSSPPPPLALHVSTALGTELPAQRWDHPPRSKTEEHSRQQGLPPQGASSPSSPSAALMPFRSQTSVLPKSIPRRLPRPRLFRR